MNRMSKHKHDNWKNGSSAGYESPEMEILDFWEGTNGTADIILTSSLGGNGNFTEETKPGDSVIDGGDWN